MMISMDCNALRSHSKLKIYEIMAFSCSIKAKTNTLIKVQRMTITSKRIAIAEELKKAK